MKMIPIPISAAKEIAINFGYDQVIIVARKTGESGGEHVTTYGKNQNHCKISARVGAFLKNEVMKWHGLPRWFGRIVYSGEGIVKEQEFKTEAEAEAYKSGAEDMRSLSDESFCDCDPLDDHFVVASNQPAIHEDNAMKCQTPKCQNIVDKKIQNFCDDHGGVICG